MAFISFLISAILICLYTYPDVTPLGGKVVAIIALLWFSGMLVIQLWKGVALRAGMAQIVIIYAALVALSMLSVAFKAYDTRYGAALTTSTLLPIIFSVAVLLQCAKWKNGVLAFLLLQCLFSLSLIIYFYYEYGIALRSTGIPFVNESINNIATILAAVAAVAVVIALKANTPSHRLLAWILFLILLVGVGLTYSKGAVSIVLVTGLMLILFYLRRESITIKLTLFGTLILLASFGVNYFDDAIGSEWFSIFIARWDSVGESLRHETHRIAWIIFQENYLLGAGYSNFPAIFGRYSSYSAPLRMHDDIAETFVELGIFGGMLIMGIIAASARAWWRASRNRYGQILLPGFLVVMIFTLIRPMQSFWIWPFFVLLPFFGIEGGYSAHKNAEK